MLDMYTSLGIVVAVVAFFVYFKRKVKKEAEIKINEFKADQIDIEIKKMINAKKEIDSHAGDTLEEARERADKFVRE